MKLKGYRKIISFTMFCGVLGFGLLTTLKSDNPSAFMVFAAFAPTLGTAFGAIIWGFRGAYARDAAAPQAPKPPMP